MFFDKASQRHTCMFNGFGKLKKVKTQKIFINFKNRHNTGIKAFHPIHSVINCFFFTSLSFAPSLYLIAVCFFCSLLFPAFPHLVLIPYCVDAFSVFLVFFHLLF